ncbi:PAS domain-containing protein [Wandonia haliotis]|uniref:histidine kinase n=1 Tax=Wandonia haliotis TaxID=574963 RepID=A0ABN1MPD9_9FLAO
MTTRNNELITVWIIEDNPGDAFLLQELLVFSGFSSRNIVVFESLQKAVDGLADSVPDIVLLDLFLPDFSGLETFEFASEKFHSVPIIVMSGMSDTDVALQTVKKGAQDFILKGNSDTNILVKSIHYSIERKRNIQQLIQSEEEFRLLFEASPLPILLVNDTLQVLRTNNAFLDLYRCSLSDVRQMKLTDFLAEDESDRRVEYAVKNQRESQFRHITADGNVLYVSQLAARTTFRGEEVYTIIIKDETEKYLFEQEKLKIVEETLEGERERFSRELHDGLAQHLVALNFYVSQLSGISEGSDEVVANAQSMIKTSLDMTRAMCYNLTPPELEKGLVAGLKAMFDRLGSVTEVEMKLNVSDLITDKAWEQVDHYSVYRMVQEFVNNSVKHSECKQIECNFDLSDDDLVILVEDNGKGFQRDEIKPGLGLKNLEQRAIAAEINLEFKSNPGEGTKLIMRKKVRN